MSEERPTEVKKVLAYAADMTLPAKLRTNAIEQLAKISTREAFVALLELATNEGLITKERDFALKKAREVLKRTSPL
ncbi:MAG: hypothetical protein QF906_00110 [Dehalococcoidales bacterium]|jgi:hypothetical protein|nr:hypothetical protein [Dehalococcoidales bacterium]MDP6448747.1 hypothetical protein [Dehalococcoidales bacterium]MDP6576497.1 hypothetical protein [Dehalococcoidales bacterium]MDP7285703.1 hypothetical protein [Dehalococcoidales bacterium]MDP7415248.1 hypothetical protein [Dehalococcoidales bacterium]|tara:strand:- start:43 stop:273 length:231 start_codon:yes stop_codon:yes gene_type:complete